MSVKRDDELMFYTECWRELRNFLAEVVRDNTGEYLIARSPKDLTLIRDTISKRLSV